MVAGRRFISTASGYRLAMSHDMQRSDENRKSTEKDVPAIRETQSPMGQPAPKEDSTRVSGDDPNDPLREEAAERARRAVEPGQPRE